MLGSAENCDILVGPRCVDRTLMVVRHGKRSHVELNVRCKFCDGGNFPRTGEVCRFLFEKKRIAPLKKCSREISQAVTLLEETEDLFSITVLESNAVVLEQRLSV